MGLWKKIASNLRVELVNLDCILCLIFHFLGSYLAPVDFIRHSELSAFVRIKGSCAQKSVPRVSYGENRLGVYSKSRNVNKASQRIKERFKACERSFYQAGHKNLMGSRENRMS